MREEMGMKKGGDMDGVWRETNQVRCAVVHSANTPLSTSVLLKG